MLQRELRSADVLQKQYVLSGCQLTCPNDNIIPAFTIDQMHGRFHTLITYDANSRDGLTLTIHEKICCWTYTFTLPPVTGALNVSLGAEKYVVCAIITMNKQKRRHAYEKVNVHCLAWRRSLTRITIGRQDEERRQNHPAQAGRQWSSHVRMCTARQSHWQVKN